MNQNQVLQLMGMEVLPSPSKTPIGKCIALVERAGGDRDYIIFQNGGIVADKKPTSAVRSIIEYYPVVKEKKVVDVDPEVEVVVAPAPVVIPEPPKKIEYQRDDAIHFLTLKGMNAVKMKSKSDDELRKLLKVYKR